MNEKAMVDFVARSMISKGYHVRTEIANFHRSADICMVDDEGKIWVIECKISSISKAIEQSRTHKLAADKVFIATLRRKTRDSILKQIRKAGLGLIYVEPDGSVSESPVMPKRNKPWQLARTTLLRRIQGEI